MEVLYDCCCGIDVHKKKLAANLLRRAPDGREEIDEVRTFGTMTGDLLELAEWLKEAGCTHVAMESTGVYWKPVFNILEGKFEVVLVNARHIKTVPGRKTDVQDCQWIAQLLQHGLLRASFIPPRLIRELRDLTRQRRSLIEERSAAVKRIHKVLEDCNIKLSSVATDVMGASGRDMIQALIDGEQDPLKLAALARGRLKAKRESLQQALHGHVTEHHRFMLRLHWAHIASLDRLVADLDQQIEEQVRPFAEIIALLDQVPGIGETAAKSLIAEIGVDMDQFPNQHHLASWAGMSPGNNESAGKRKSGTTTKGNRWLRATLGEVACAAARTKRSYLSARYRRLAARRGHNRSVVAVGHKILTIVYFIIKDRVTYDDLGEDYYDRQRQEQLKRHHIKRLQRLGYHVEVTEATHAA